jgi:hypothetical protein
LSDNNSVAQVNPNSQAGMFDWMLQGQNVLQQQWFWYGIGNSAVRSIDTINAPTAVQASSRELLITYGIPGSLSVAVDYLLTGGTIVGSTGGNLNSDIGETIKLVNLGRSTLPLHFYQYSYFNLLGMSSDVVQLGTNPRGLYNDALQLNVGTGSTLSETVTTPGANHGEVAPLGATLVKLNGGGPVTLGSSVGSGPVGPGAVTWAFEWDFNIAPGGSAIISKDKNVYIALIPEPSVAALAGIGFVVLAWRRHPRSENWVPPPTC